MTRQDIKFLQSAQKYPSVSIFIPTHRRMPEREQDPIRVKNAVTEAKNRLLEEYSARDMRALFDRIDNLVLNIDYTQLRDGLAIYVNQDWGQVYNLPFHVDNRVEIDKTFVTRDLVYGMNRQPRYWVLMLCEKPSRLFYGLGKDLSEVSESLTDYWGVPKDGFPYEYTGPEERVIEAIDDGERDSVYLDSHKAHFFRKVDELLGRFINVDPLPLIVSGDERNISFFKNHANHAKHIVAVLEGHYSDADYHEKKLEEHVWGLMEAYLQEQRKKTLHDFEEKAIGSLHHAFGIDAVWRMAQEGRIHELLVEKDYMAPGLVNPENSLDLTLYDQSDVPGISDDLVNILIEQVIEKGGTITFFEPGALSKYEHIAAILRY